MSAEGNNEEYQFDPDLHYAVGAYVDAKDSVNRWCLAKIIDRNEDMVNVHFDGWSSRWNEWYSINSNKVGPFRKYTKGYTGQSKVALRDWKFSLAELDELEPKLIELIKNSLKGLGAYDATQFYRGRLY
eukprot:CAMPEP_0115012418 /NCGR_PEP_ID=MMETSP0216-20121206/24723_1 /TAXON_ID=223996 /ORGANISM="Protocruzia adherens, Strain Boccale" /LENGTH=128 /DNA_ID=CAMNT_0002381467 /DNA_START=123 /DNA_END=506 /DNA_ORIENTATION=+